MLFSSPEFLLSTALTAQFPYSFTSVLALQNYSEWCTVSSPLSTSFPSTLSLTLGPFLSLKLSPLPCATFRLHTDLTQTTWLFSSLLLSSSSEKLLQFHSWPPCFFFFFLLNSNKIVFQFPSSSF